MKKRYAIWKATSRCNSRCNMCGIWKSKDAIDNDPNEVYKSVKVLNITGGEPFLRKDLVDIQEFHFPNVKLVQISTNGTVYGMHEIIAGFKPKVSVTLSIDGDYPETHDKIRGVKGSWFRAMSSYHELLNMSNVRVGLQYTLQESNIEEAFRFFLMYRNVTFNVLIDDAEFYKTKQKGNKVKYYSRVMDFLKIMKRQDRLRRYYYNHLIEALTDGRKSPCLFKEGRAIYIDDKGNEHRCPYKSDCNRCISMCDSILHPFYHPIKVIGGLIR